MRTTKSNKNSIKIIMVTSGVVCLLIAVFGLGYALFKTTLTGKKKTHITTGKISLQLLDQNNNDITDISNAGYSINLENAVPVEDSKGLEQEGFVFKLKNNGTIDTKYTIYLDNEELAEGEERILDKYIKYSLTKNEGGGTPKLLSSLTERILDNDVIKTGQTNTYTLKLWIDYDADNEIMNKVFSTTLRVEGKQYIESSSTNEETIPQELTTEVVKKTLSAEATSISFNTTKGQIPKLVILTNANYDVDGYTNLQSGEIRYVDYYQDTNSGISETRNRVNSQTQFARAYHGADNVASINVTLTNTTVSFGRRSNTYYLADVEYTLTCYYW